MQTRFYIIFIIPAVVFLSGCGRCGGEGKTNCDGNSGLGVEIIGFDSIQLDTIYVLQFKKGTNFKNIVDTLTLVQGLSFSLGMVGDTAYISSYPAEFFQNGIETFYGSLIAANYDSEIIIPGLKTVKISNISLYPAYRCYDDRACPYPNLAPFECAVTSFQQDGVTYNFTVNAISSCLPISNAVAYIMK